MGIPYLQIEADFITTTAALVAARAGISEMLALGMGVKLFSLAVTETADKDTPPDGCFVDPDAADVIEHLLGWTGERGRLITAFERAGVIERLEVGLRIRGIDRYRRTWEKNRRRTGEKPAPVVPVTGKNRRVDGDGDGDGDEGKAVAAPPPTSRPKPKPPAVVLPPEAEAWLVWQSGEWEQRFASLTSPPPAAEFLAWWGAAMADLHRLGQGEEQLRAAYRAFLADPFWASKSRRRCPWSGWVAQWRDFLPTKEAATAGRMEFRELAPGEDPYAEDAA